MKIKKLYKPSFHKANARYRGVTELSQYTNFVLESTHDLVLLSNVTTGNEAVQQKGLEKEIYDNFVSVMTGDKEVGKSNLFTASTLLRVDRIRKSPVTDLASWSKLNGCTLTQSGDVITLSSQGLQDPVGLYKTIYAEPGDKFYIRLKVRSQAGAPDFSFGSNNIRVSSSSKGDTRKVALEGSTEFITLDYILRSNYAGAISININVHQKPSVLKATTIEVKDLEVFYMEEAPVKLSSYDQIIKPNLDELEEKINSIR